MKLCPRPKLRQVLPMPQVRDLAPVQRDDLAVCTALLREGSKSFALAQRLLPAALKGPVTALYAFCRQADDAIDEADNASGALAALHVRLDRIFSGVNLASPVDRALSHAVQAYALPRSVFDAMLEGFAWDAQGRSYETLSDVIAYSARVASTVGILMTLMMGRREPWVLGRAAELGVAMQLTNIARDVGADRALGRVYLPGAWFRPYGMTAADIIASAPVIAAGGEACPAQTPQRIHNAVAAGTARLLACAEPLYGRADSALGALPWRCRFAIDAAARIYRDIGRSLHKQRYDSLHQRAWVRLPRKLWLVMGAVSRQLYRSIWPVKPYLYQTLPELQFLIDAVHPEGSMPAARLVPTTTKRQACS